MSEPAGHEAPLRVLHFIASLTHGGAERQLVLLVRFSDRSRIRHGVCFFETGPHFEQLRSATPDLWHIPRRHRFSLTYPLALRRPLREFRPHVVQTWLAYMDIVGTLVVRLSSQTPVLVTERNTRVKYENALAPRVLKLRNLCRRHLATAVVANSEGGREYVQQDVRVRAPVVVIKNGLDLGAVDAAAAADLSALRRDGGPLLLFCGRLTPIKNLETLLRALPAVAAAHPGVRLLVCGSGPQEAELRALGRSLGVEANTEWLGFRSDVLSLMKACDLLVHPSFAEGDPNVLAEGAAACIPLCVSDTAPHREFAGTTPCAAFFDPHRPEALSRCVLEVLADDAAREHSVAEARVLSESRSAHRMAEQYEAVYRRFALEER